MMGLFPPKGVKAQKVYIKETIKRHKIKEDFQRIKMQEREPSNGWEKFQGQFLELRGCLIVMKGKTKKEQDL